MLNRLKPRAVPELQIAENIESHRGAIGQPTVDIGMKSRIASRVRNRIARQRTIGTENKNEYADFLRRGRSYVIVVAVHYNSIADIVGPPGRKIKVGANRTAPSQYTHAPEKNE